jgi:hypothetical protein
MGRNEIPAIYLEMKTGGPIALSVVKHFEPPVQICVFDLISGHPPNSGLIACERDISSHDWAVRMLKARRDIHTI